MPSFPTERARLKVRNPAGDVRVEAADVAETTVELVPLNSTDATRQAIENARVEAVGDDVFVELVGRNWTLSIGEWSVGRAAKVGVRIRCPQGSDLDCDTASAPVAAGGRLGDVKVRTASGTLQLDHVGGMLHAKSASGDLRVERVDGRAEVHTVSGDVEVRHAAEAISVNAISGDVEIGAAGAPLSVTSVSGDLRIGAAGPGEIQLKSVSGDVDVALRTALAVRLDVNSVSGTITSELEVGEAPPTVEGPEADLRVRTVSGDVRIGRVQSPASESARIALA